MKTRKWTLVLFLAVAIFLIGVGMSGAASYKYGLKKVFLWDRAFSALMLASMVYLLWNYDAIQSRAGFPEMWDIAFGLVMIVMLLEMTRRVVGLALPIIRHFRRSGRRVGHLYLYVHPLWCVSGVTMVASLILGMGLPTSACYIVLAVLAAPVRTNLGFPLLASHLFIFYFGIISAITPPVALAAYAGSGIAGANPFKTAVTSLSLDLSAFFIPYWFIFNPELLLGKGGVANIVVIFISAIGIVSLSAMTQGFLLRKLNTIERITALLITFALLMVDFKWRALGLSVFAAMLIHQKMTLIPIAKGVRRIVFDYAKCYL